MAQKKSGEPQSVALQPEQLQRFQNLRLERRVCELEIENHKLRLERLNQMERQLADGLRAELGGAEGEILIDLENSQALLKEQSTTN